MNHSYRCALGLLLGAFASIPTSACTSGELGDSSFSPSLGAGSAATSAAATGNEPSNAGSPSTSAGSGGSNAGGGGPTPSAGMSANAGHGNGGAGASNGGSSSASNGGAPPVACNDLPPNNGDTCAHAVEYGWCAQSWIGASCRQSCGKCSAGSGGASGVAGSTGSAGTTGGAGAPPVLQGGSNGWATRYWDCCKPACGWKGNVPSGSNPVSSCSISNQSFGGDYDQQSACPNGNNGGAFMCQNFGPWAVSDTLAYGFAAVSKGSDYCGRCYQLQFTGTSHNASTDTGSASLAGKTMIVQAINNGGVDGNQFDLLIPGGGVGDFNACATQWGTSSLGEQYGGFFLACQKANAFDYTKAKACAAAKCQSVFASKPDLLTSCTWFVGWFGAPDNPAVLYKEVTCPAAITSLSGLHR
jgi:hypothetical protein